MMRPLLGGAATLLVGVLTYPWLISGFQRWKVGQPIREEGPPAHLSREGTPTAGGVLFVLLGAAAVLVVDRHRDGALLALALLVGALLGGLDDFQKLAAGRNLGIRARFKILIQAAMGIGLAALLYRAGFAGQYVPGRGLVSFGLWLVPLAALAIVATSNAVNLTDGSDGLAAGLTAIAFLILAAVAVRAGQIAWASALAAVAGAVLAFLWFNLHPARLFMGDTGSLALGTALAVAAIEAHLLWLLPLLGLVFVLETLSVIVQVAVFQRTGRRVLRMSPLHNHFHLLGWGDERIAAVFWAAGAACALLVFLLTPVALRVQ
jgi:phospho-N-acetylmuramoyl-pentapeptide-transferase